MEDLIARLARRFACGVHRERSKVSITVVLDSVLGEVVVVHALLPVLLPHAV